MSLEIVNNIYDLTNKVPTPKYDVRIYIDTKDYIADSKLQIYLQMEPEAIYPIREYLLENYKRYNTILTFDKEVLSKCENAVKFTFYTITWLDEEDYKNIDISKKTYKISCLVGFKQMAPGHTVRLILYFQQMILLNYPFTFYRSCVPPHLPEILTNPFLGSKEINAKRDLFMTYQFHLAIENSKQENYFTEKLIDCLITKTIPIYYGCPNIQEYFDTSGWILLETGEPSEVIQKCSVLHESYYINYIETIEKNYKLALYYKDNIGRLNNILKEIPGYT
jgi:hypothetical protein